MSGHDAWLRARNLLAVRLDNAGDVIMLGPALRAIKSANPAVRLTLLASPAGAKAVALLPWIDDIVVFRSVWQDLGHLPFQPARELAFVHDLAERAFDGALIFTSFSQTPHVAGYVCYLAGIPLRAGESKEFGGAVLSDGPCPADDDLHQVDRNLRLVRSVGFPSDNTRLEIALPAEADERAGAWLVGNGIGPGDSFVLLHPGASASARRYRTETYGGVARLLRRQGWPVVVTGTAREAALLDRVAANADGDVVRCDELGLPEFAALVARASALVCGNTLPMHLADATRTPVVALYSGTDLVTQWQPRFAPSRILRRPVSCAPCYRIDCPIGQPCLDVPPHEVVAAVNELIGMHGAARLPQQEMVAC
jgi:ADP-heptose:LPS heptosyltransferase